MVWIRTSQGTKAQLFRLQFIKTENPRSQGNLENKKKLKQRIEEAQAQTDVGKKSIPGPSSWKPEGLIMSWD